MELSYYYTVFLVGLLFLNLLNKNESLSRLFLYTASFPFGVLLIALCAGVLTLLRLGSSIFGIFLCLVAGYLLLRKALGFGEFKPCKRKIYEGLAVSVLVIVALGGVSLLNHGMVMSFDSIKQLVEAGAIAVHGEAYLETNGVALASWGMVLLGVVGCMNLLGVDYPVLFPSVVYTSFLALFLGTSIECAIQNKTRKLDKFLWILISVALTVTAFGPFMVVWQFFYFHNNLLAACLIFLMVVTLFRVRTGGWGKPECVLVFLVLLGASLVRVETPIVTAVLTFSILRSAAFQGAAVRKVLYFVVGGIAIWYLFLLSLIGGGSDILSPAKIPVVIGPWLLALVVMYLGVRINSFKWLLRVYPFGIFCSAVVACVLVFTLGYDHMSASFFNMVNNYLTYWGVVYFIALGASVLGVFNKDTRGIVLGLFSYIIIVLVLSYFRTPFRVGWGDSGNRLSLSMYPLMWTIVIILFSKLNFSFLTKKNYN